MIWPKHGNSAAWLKKRGETQVINTISTYNSDRYFNSSGKATKSNIEFSKKELNIYYEKGITDNITFGYNSLVQEQRFLKNNSNDPIFDFRQCGLLSAANVNSFNVSIAELELFFRKKLYEKDRLIISVEPSLSLPCMLLGDGFDFVDNTTDAKIKFLLGFDFQTNFLGKTQNNFVNSELSYRKRHNKFADQLRLDNTYGMHLNDKNMLMAQAFALMSLGEEDV